MSDQHASALFECLEAEERKFELRLKASLPNLQRQSDLLLLAPVKGSEEEDTEAKREQRRRMQIEFVDRYLIKYFLSRYRGPVIRSGVLRLVNDLFMVCTVHYIGSKHTLTSVNSSYHRCLLLLLLRW